MKRVRRVRELKVGYVVCVVGYNDSDFSLPDPDGWWTGIGEVISKPSQTLDPNISSVDIQIYDQDGLLHVVDHMEETETHGEPFFLHDGGMAGDKMLRVFILQTRGALSDEEIPLVRSYTLFGPLGETLERDPL